MLCNYYNSYSFTFYLDTGLNLNLQKIQTNASSENSEDIISKQMQLKKCLKRNRNCDYFDNFDKFNKKYNGYVNDNDQMNGNGTLYENDHNLITGKWLCDKLVQLNILRLSIISDTVINKFTVHAEDNILLLNNDFHAKIKIDDISEIDVKVSIKSIVHQLLHKIQIIKVTENINEYDPMPIYKNFIADIQCSANLTHENIESANDMLQIYWLLRNHDIQLDNIQLSKLFLENDLISNNLKHACNNFISAQYEFEEEINVYPIEMLSKYRTKLQKNDLHKTLKKIYDDTINVHKNKLRLMYMSFTILLISDDIDKLDNWKLLFIRMENLQFFDSLDNFISKNLNDHWKIMLNNLWENYIERIRNLSSLNLLNDKSVIMYDDIYVLLFKNFVELTNEISKNTGMEIKDIIITNDNENGLKIADSFEWKIDNDDDENEKFAKSLQNKSKEIQYNFIVDKINNLKLSNKKKKISFQELTKSVKSYLGWNQKSISSNNVWLDLLKHTFSKLSEFVPNYSLNFYTNTCKSLVILFEKFTKSNTESLRITINSAIDFIVAIIPHFSIQTIDTSVYGTMLQTQLKYITDIAESHEVNNIDLKEFSNILDTYYQYWTDSDYILKKLPKIYPCNTFQTEINSIGQSILTIIIEAFYALNECKIMSLGLMINFMQTINDFIEDVDNIDFKWYVKQHAAYDLTLLEVVPNKLVNDEKKTFYVKDIERFVTKLKKRNIDIPKNYLLNIILYSLATVNELIGKKCWPNDENINAPTRIKLTMSLLEAIRSTFLYLKEQPNYRDFDIFLAETTKPFESIVDNSTSIIDFKNRIKIVKESYWYLRNQDSIGIDKAIHLFSETNESFQSVILKNCYKLYEETFANFIDTYNQYKNINTLVDMVKKFVVNIRQTDEWKCNNWPISFKINIVPKIIAGLSAIWSLLQSKDVETVGKTLNPHCIQILCIFRLLGVDDNNIGIEKHLAQVLTGQGKIF